MHERFLSKRMRLLRFVLACLVICLTSSLSIPQKGTTRPALSSGMALAQVGYVLPDLSVVVNASPAPVYEGTNLTYTITVATTNPLDATNVKVTDDLPIGVTYQSSAPVSCSAITVNRVYECHIGNIAGGGAMKTLTITVRVTPGAPSRLHNTVQAVPQEGIPPGQPIPTGTIDTEVRRAPNLSISKVGIPGTVLEGSNLTYALTATNLGLGGATGVRVSDRLPRAVRYVRSSFGSGGTCTSTYSDTEGTTVTCDIGTLGPAPSAMPISLVVVPVAVGTVSNTATVVSTEPDIDSTDNTSRIENTTVVPAADLMILKGAVAGNVGVDLTYTVSVINAGPSDATGVVVTDTLPLSLSFVSADPRCGRPNSRGQITCTIGSVARLSAARFEIVTRPTRTGDFTNTVNVAGDQQDPVMPNNAFSQRTTVYGAADLAISKTTSQSRVRYGSSLTYTLTIQNHGPSTATNVTVEDGLPTGTRSAGMAFVSATTSQGLCPRTPSPGATWGTVYCNLGDLGVGASATVSVNGHIGLLGGLPVPTPAPTPPDTVLDNTASVSADTFDPNRSNNTTTLRVVATAGPAIPYSPSGPGVTPTPPAFPK